MARELTCACPHCHFHLVLGNHDYHQAFIDRLAELERRVSNLAWHRYYVRLGSSVFLHGDVANKEMDAQMLAEAREEWLDSRRRQKERMSSVTFGRLPSRNCTSA